VGEFFGSALAAGRLGADSRADLVVGVCEDPDPEWDEARGAAHVIHGSPTGLTANNDQLWTQASPGIPGRPEYGDEFGCTSSPNKPLATGDFGLGRNADLVVGVIGEDINHHGAGAFNVIYSTGGELQGHNAQLWHQQVP
jgi:hypothetical protein